MIRECSGLGDCESRRQALFPARLPRSRRCPLKRRYVRLTSAFLIIAAAVFAVSSCGTPSYPAETVKKIDAVVAQVMKLYRVPGAIVGAWSDGKGEYLKAFGKADIKSGRQMSLQDLFKAASTTKTITGTVILELVDEGKLSLDDTLNKFDFAKGIPNADRITIRMLLNQTSGLPDPSNESADMGAVEDSDPKHTFTADEIIKYGIAMGPLAEPGQKYHYSNWNYYLLGMIAEQVSGRKLADEMQAQFFGKLGMKNTRLDPGAQFLLGHQHSNGYVWDTRSKASGEYVDATDYSTSWTWAAGSVVTDIYDFHTWIDAVAKGTLLTPQMRRTRLKDAAATGPGSAYGLGFLKTGDVIWHNGAVPGYSSYAGRDTVKGITVCVFMNIMPGPEVSGQQPMTQVILATDTAARIMKVLEAE